MEFVGEVIIHCNVLKDEVADCEYVVYGKQLHVAATDVQPVTADAKYV